MKNLISTKQLMFAVAAFILASVLQLSTIVYTFTKNETWVSVVAAVPVSMLIIAVYSKLVRDYPGLNLFEINEAVFGAAAGKAVTALYVFFFLSLMALNTRSVESFIESFLLPNTPMIIIDITFLSVCVWAARKGAQSMTRNAVLIAVLYISAIVINTLLLINTVKPVNLLPVFKIPLKKHLMSAHCVTVLPNCEILVFLSMTKYMLKPAEAGKAMRGGLLIAAATMLLMVLVETSVFGDYVVYTSLPVFNIIRIINIGDIVTRLEIIFAVQLLTVLFFKTSVLLFTTVTGVSRLFSIVNYRIFVYILGALIVVYARAVFVSEFERLKWFGAMPAYSSFFLLVLPLITLIVSAVRKRKQENSAGTPAEQQTT